MINRILMLVLFGVINFSSLPSIAAKLTISDQIEAARERPENYCHSIKEGTYNPLRSTVLIVDKQSFCTYVLQTEDNSSSVVSVFSTPNSIGRAGHETRLGVFRANRIVQFPTWQNPDNLLNITGPYDVDKRNPLGVGAITLAPAVEFDHMGGTKNEIAMALHGTNHEELVGKRRVSGGCIRHHNFAIQLIMNMIRKDDFVIIVGDLNNIEALPLRYFQPTH